MITTFFYLIVWACVITLQATISSDIWYPVPYYFYIFWIFSLILLAIADIIVPSPKINFPIIDISGRQRLMEKWLFFIFLTAASASAVSANFEFPILKLFGFAAADYNHYGVSGLQGFTNSCYLAISTLSLVRILAKDKKTILDNGMLIAVFFYPLALFSRQMIFTLVVQLVIFWILFSKKSFFNKASKITGLFLISLFIFWFLGSARTGDKVILSFMGQDASNSFAFLYWPYIYLTSSLSNLSLNITSSEPDYSIVTFFLFLIPTPLRVYLGLDNGFEQFSNMQLINPNLNMATYFSSGYLSFGWMGMAISFIILLASFLIIKCKASKNIYNFCSYLVIVQIIIFTFFANLLFYLPVVFQIIIFTMLSLCNRRKSKLIKTC